MPDDQQVDIANALSPEYRETLMNIAAKGECPAPFCKDEGNGHRHPIEHEFRFWRVTRNSFNYQNARIPFLIPYRGHINSVEEMDPAAMAELQEIICMLKRVHGAKSSALIMREGDTTETGASVYHLHAQLIFSYAKPGGGEPIKTVIGFGPPPNP